MRQILIIDDDQQIRLLLKKIFEKEGFRVIEAQDGNEGIRKFREKGADLVITDLVMPEKEGIETIIELKKEFPDVKIIAISGGGLNIPDAYLDVAKFLGAIHTFSKPFVPADLLAVVDQIFSSAP